MTKQISDWFASRTAVTGTLGAGDKLFALQNGVLKSLNPQYAAVTLDAGGSGKRCLATATYVGVDDFGKDIWVTEGVTA